MGLIVNSLPSNIFPVFNISEQYDPSKGVRQDEEEHAHNNEETLEHRHNHGEHEHFQRRMFTRDRKKTKNDDHESKHMGLVVLNVSRFINRRKCSLNALELPGR